MSIAALLNLARSCQQIAVHISTRSQRVKCLFNALLPQSRRDALQARSRLLNIRELLRKAGSVQANVRIRMPTVGSGTA